MTPLAKLLIGLGIALVIAGLWLSWEGRPNLPLGRLPLDFRYEREGFSFYFPLGTCLLISAIVSLLFWFFRR